jgi:hypothetical protein
MRIWWKMITLFVTLAAYQHTSFALTDHSQSAELVSAAISTEKLSITRIKWLYCPSRLQS